MAVIRANIQVNGIVQGVGFRPFIHKLITGEALSGWIRNTSEGAEIELEGEEASVRRFLSDLRTKTPKLAVIESVHTAFFSELMGYQGFEIRQSKALQERNTLISPDVGICEDCLRELFDPADRRYRYPFINCTNCGPRFTIIKDVPYDRCKTTMGVFPMCPACEAEYKTITDRRYHAQPDCCPVCGPHVFLLDAAGRPVEGDPIEQAIRALEAGKLVAVKGLGGIHLACRCDLPEAAMTLRRRKHRDEKPFAIMCRDAEAARRYCRITPEEQTVLESFRRPIVLLEKKEKGSLPHISDNGYVGVMLPYTPLHYLLLSGGLDSLIMTSANLSDMPILYKNEQALRELSGIADFFLLHNREIHTRCDDSLLWVVDGKEYPVRRSRGYAPFPLSLAGAEGQLLACGAEQKASFSLTKGRYVFQSQHIGDLKNLETYENYQEQIRHFSHMFDIHPTLIACDLHPDYLSTEYAEERAAEEHIPLLRIQHHWAHMASCMADNGLEGECIGIVWDGTGYGTDGTVWGGEFLTGGYEGFARAGSLRPFALPGGDRVTKELWRTAISLLEDAGEEPGAFFLPEQVELVRTLLQNGLNSPVCTSMGRLFDGVCALLGIRQQASYEGQGAILLETAAEPCETVYPYALLREEGLLRMDFRPMIRALCQDRRQGTPAGQSAQAFLNTLADMALKLCEQIRAETGLDRVVLSGGTFQNRILLHRLPALLREAGFAVYHHSRVSTNDEGVSFGQAAIAERSGKHHVSCHTAGAR